MSELVKNLRNITQDALNGGGPEAIKRHTSRGKLLARERIDQVRSFQFLIHSTVFRPFILKKIIFKNSGSDGLVVLRNLSDSEMFCSYYRHLN